jgi:hypothetical protein
VAKNDPVGGEVYRPGEEVIETFDYEDGRVRKMAFTAERTPLIDAFVRYVDDEVYSVTGRINVEDRKNIMTPRYVDSNEYPTWTGDEFEEDLVVEPVEKDERNIIFEYNSDTDNSRLYFEEYRPDLSDFSSSMAAHLNDLSPVNMAGRNNDELSSEWEQINWEKLIHRTLTK